MTVFFTADHHFGHARINTLAGRPFDTVDDMNTALIDRWNTTVGPDDHVWVLGDFAMGRIADSLPLAKKLNGHKFLIAGNHDRIHPSHGHTGDKLDAWTAKYTDAGFTIVPHGPIFPGIHASHFPFTGDHTDDDRHTAHRLPDDGNWLLHGHTHGMWRKRGRMIDVGVDAWNGFPVPWATIVDLMNTGSASDFAATPWTVDVAPPATLTV